MKIKEDCGHGSKDGKAHCEWSEKKEVPPKRRRGLGSLDGSGRCDVSNCSIGKKRTLAITGGEGMDRISGQRGTSFGK